MKIFRNTHFRLDDDATLRVDMGAASASSRHGAFFIIIMSDSIRKFTFKGHKGSVLCLAHDSSSCLLLSGAEDCTSRLWDLRTSKTALCLMAGGDVTSVAFAPQLASPEALVGPFAKDNTM